jgi:hypothetical protein
MFMPSAPQMSSKTNTAMVASKYGALEDARMPSIRKADIARERGLPNLFE